MSEHRIRLRAAWEVVAPAGEDEPRSRHSRRLDLPLAWLDPDSVPRRLRRSFQLPRLSRASEELFLRLEGVPGLDSVWLDGRKIASGPGAAVAIEIPLRDLERRRHVLELELNGMEAAASAAPWGNVSLVIRAASPLHADPGSQASGHL